MKLTLYIFTLLLFITTSYAENQGDTGFFKVADAQNPTTREIVYARGQKERKLPIEVSPLASKSDIDFIERVPGSLTGLKITLTKKGNIEFVDKIKNLKGKEMAVIIDGKVIMVAVLQSTHFGGTFTLDDCVTESEAVKIADQFKK